MLTSCWTTVTIACWAVGLALPLMLAGASAACSVNKSPAYHRQAGPKLPTSQLLPFNLENKILTPSPGMQTSPSRSHTPKARKASRPEGAMAPL